MTSPPFYLLTLLYFFVLRYDTDLPTRLLLSFKPPSTFSYNTSSFDEDLFSSITFKPYSLLHTAVLRMTQDRILASLLTLPSLPTCNISALDKHFSITCKTPLPYLAESGCMRSRSDGISPQLDSTRNFIRST